MRTIKKITMGLAIVLAGFFILTPLANAIPIVAGDWIKETHGYGTVGGGEFAIAVSTTQTAAGPYVSAGFKTFCLETNEYLADPFYVASVTKQAINGGTGGGSPDPISGATAYLYYHYIVGDLNTISEFQYNTDAGVDALQRAIWYLEDEVTPTGWYGQNNYLVALGMASEWQEHNFTGNVFVMNLQDKWGNRTQDMLEVVPEPVTLVLLGFGLLGLGLVRRKIK